MFRGLPKDKIEVLKKIDNPDVADTYIEKIANIAPSEQYDLLILTTDDFKNGFQPLKNTHDLNGIKTEIKTLRDISIFPDRVTSEDIRDFIREEHLTNGIEYVLIGGDADVVPVQMLYVFGLDEDTWPYETIMPSDLYYACLDGTFNYDDDNKWGEPTDGPGGGDVDLVHHARLHHVLVQRRRGSVWRLYDATADGRAADFRRDLQLGPGVPAPRQAARRLAARGCTPGRHGATGHCSDFVSGACGWWRGVALSDLDVARHVYPGGTSLGRD